jgi:hypothetical protein
MALLQGEDPAAFEKLHRDIMTYKPVGGSEEDVATNVGDLCTDKIY